MHRLDTETDLNEVIASLIVIEPRFTPVLKRHGLPSLRHMEPGLKSLLRIVTDQLVSLKAGEAIWRRLDARLGSFECSTVLACSFEELKSLGLSGAKARTFHAAAATFDGFPQVEFEALSDQEAFARLTHIPGIGPWTAQVYLLSVLRRPDAWPAGDLALQVAAQNLFGLTKRPDSKTMLRLAEPWRPFRAAAARLLWSHYRGLKGMNQHII